MFLASRVPRKTQGRNVCVLLMVLCALLLGGCASTSSATSRAQCSTTTSLSGEGSTFDAPLFNTWFSVYPQTSCGLTVEYYATGSGMGISTLLGQLMDFGATDAPLTARQLASSPNGPILHIPVTLGLVAISYHLHGISAPLKFTGALLASIYLGTITWWDDPAIQQLNPGTVLPHVAIQVLHRSDGSGTTAIFTHYLAAISPAWKARVGASTTVHWPTGQGEQGSGGVAEALGSTEGALGYIEWSYVVKQHLPAALLQNQAGAFLAPSIAGAQAAAAAFPSVPTDLRFYIVNAPGANAYPIAGYSWVIVYQQQSDAEKGKALSTLLWWMVHQGQQYAEPLSYAPLPGTMVSLDEAQIRRLTCGSNRQAC
jgi:phosphate transport system substrate-binding protein